MDILRSVILSQVKDLVRVRLMNRFDNHRVIATYAAQSFQLE